jgi:hypothetical protein
MPDNDRLSQELANLLRSDEENIRVQGDRIQVRVDRSWQNLGVDRSIEGEQLVVSRRRRGRDVAQAKMPVLIRTAIYESNPEDPGNPMVDEYIFYLCGDRPTPLEILRIPGTLDPLPAEGTQFPTEATGVTVVYWGVEEGGTGTLTTEDLEYEFASNWICAGDIQRFDGPIWIPRPRREGDPLSGGFTGYVDSKQEIDGWNILHFAPGNLIYIWVWWYIHPITRLKDFSENVRNSFWKEGVYSGRNEPWIAYTSYTYDPDSPQSPQNVPSPPSIVEDEDPTFGGPKPITWEYIGSTLDGQCGYSTPDDPGMGDRRDNGAFGYLSPTSQGVYVRIKHSQNEDGSFPTPFYAYIPGQSDTIEILDGSQHAERDWRGGEGSCYDFYRNGQFTTIQGNRVLTINFVQPIATIDDGQGGTTELTLAQAVVGNNSRNVTSIEVGIRNITDNSGENCVTNPPLEVPEGEEGNTDPRTATFTTNIWRVNLDDLEGEEPTVMSACPYILSE